MTFLVDTTKDMFTGVANVIPGVSGGTMAVSLGIYDKLTSSISNLLKDWRKSLAVLLPTILDCDIGIVGFPYAVEFLLSKYTFVTCMTFVGLILGGIPVLVKALGKDLHKKGSSTGVSGVIAFLALFAMTIFLPMLNEDTGVLKTFTPTAETMISLFLVGIIVSATMVVPGVSSSLMMMVLGYYYGILEAIRPFIEVLRNLSTVGLLNGLLLLFPLGIEVLLGIFLTAKLITFLFERYGVQTYCTILGLIVASPFVILYNTGLFEQLSPSRAGSMLVGIVLAVVGAMVARYLGEQSR